MNSLRPLVATALILTPLAAFAEDESAGFAGGFGGRRAQWLEAGVTPFLNYTLDGLANLDGGWRRGESVQGASEFGVEFDLGKLVQWEGARLHFHGLYFHGDDPSVELVGDANYLDNITSRGGARLFEVWADAQRGRWNFKVGLLAADTDFGVSEPANLFVNSSYGPMVSYAYNCGAPIWPLSGLGARAAGTVGENGFLRIGVYDGLVEDTHENRRGFEQKLSSDEGLLAIAELGSAWSTDGRAGSWTFGVWWHSGTFTDYRDESSVKHNHGYHLLLEEALSADGRWKAFGRVGYAPRTERSYVRLHADAGVTVDGLIPGRADDTLGLACFSTRFSTDYLAARRDAGDSVSKRESGLELTYSISLGRSVWLQPDLQYIFSPHESDSDATVAILRLYVEF